MLVNIFFLTFYGSSGCLVGSHPVVPPSLSLGVGWCCCFGCVNSIEGSKGVVVDELWSGTV